MTFCIDDSQTLTEIYGNALIVLREISVEEEKGTAVCRCCNHAKSKHINDGRCTSYATSRTFINDRHEERQKALEAAELIEKLRAL